MDNFINLSGSEITTVVRATVAVRHMRSVDMTGWTPEMKRVFRLEIASKELASLRNYAGREIPENIQNGKTRVR